MTIYFKLLGVFLKRAICIVLVFALLSSICFTVVNAYSLPLVGSRESNVYHYSDCPSAKNIKQENLITFTDAQDAVNQGYRPCGTCHPPQPGNTIAPTATPSPTPSPTPTAKPTITPTPSPTPSATTKPTENPTVTAKPATTPTPMPTPSQTATSTQTPQPTATPTSSPTQTSSLTPTPISTPTTTGTLDTTSPIDPTPQPQIISSSPAPSVPELGIPSLLTILMLASILALFGRRQQRKKL